MTLLTVLTTRTNSERLSKKAIADVNGKPLIAWIVERLKQLPGTLVLATTPKKSDDVLEEIAKEYDVYVMRGSEKDVIHRIDTARKMFCPEATFIFRALGDMPFVNTVFIKHALKLMKKERAEAFVWATSPDHLQTILYGSREFPYNLNAWHKIYNGSIDREHVDSYFHENRHLFKIMYHEPPTNVFFRNYRLEVDWQEDLDLIQEIAKSVGMLASVDEIVSFLNENPEVAMINRFKVEKTGPSVYDYDVKRNWLKIMRGKPIMGWDGEWLLPRDNNSTPIFCKSGECLMGYGDGGVLYTKSGDRIVGKAYLKCNCGSGLWWNDPIKKGK